MIRVDVNGDGVLVGDLAPDSVAYLDAAWLPRSSGSVPAFVVTAEGVLSWSPDAARGRSLDVDPNEAVAGALREVAREAVAALGGIEPTRVEVIGTGLVASEVRRQLGSGGKVDSPQGIVETTGDPDAIAAALQRVADLGTVVLAGPLGTRRLDLDLYPEVHRRSLTVTGVSPRVQAADAPTPAVASADPTTIRSGQRLSGDGLWFRVVPADTDQGRV